MSLSKRFFTILTALALIVMILPPISIAALDTGLNAATGYISGSSWSNPDRVYVSDDSYATTDQNNKRVPYTFNIPSIPIGSTIDGIEVAIEGKTTGRQAEVILSWDGSNYTSGAGLKMTSLTATENTILLGGASDKWGTSHIWASSDFTNANFRVRINSTNTSGTISVDQIQVKVYYTPDTTAPTCPAPTFTSVSGINFSAGNNVYFSQITSTTGSFKVTIAATDSGSGIAKVNLPSITSFTATPSGGGDDTSSPYERTYGWGNSANGVVTGVTVTCYDNAGNTATSTFNVYKDNTSPIVNSLTLDKYAVKNGDSITIIGNVIETGSGINQCLAYLSENTGSSVSGDTLIDLGTDCIGSTTVNDTGNHNLYVKLRVSDNVGYWPNTYVLSTPLVVDNLAPTTTNDSNSVHTHYFGSHTVNLAATDNGSGVASTYYLIGDSGLNPNLLTQGTIGTSAVIACPGVISCTKLVYYASIDNVGNMAAVERSYAVEVLNDVTPPTTTDNAPAGWQNAPFAVTLTCDDGVDGSGCASTHYALDGVPGVGNTVAINTEGDHTITYHSHDLAGNTETPDKSVHAKLDTTSPNLGAVAINDGAPFVVADSVGIYTIGVTDNLSGPSQMKISNDGTNYSLYDYANPYVSWLLSVGDGLKTIYVKILDAAGNESEVKSNTITHDSTSPVIAYQPDLDFGTDFHLSTKLISSYTLPAASDNLDPNPTVWCTPTAPFTASLGSNTITCNAEDTAGNHAVPTTFSINISDTEAPFFTAFPSDIFVNNDVGQNGAIVNFSVLAQDNVDSSVSPACTVPSGSFFPVGGTAVTCSATDSVGNSTNGTFMITVADNEPPVIAYQADLDFGTDFHLSTKLISSYTLPAASDNLDPNPTVWCTPTAPFTASLGSNTITCNAEDTAGNHAVPTTFSINISDTEAPFFTAFPSDIFVNNDVGQNGAIVNFSVLAQDNVDSSVSPACTVPSGSFFPVGGTAVTCSATDSVGNSTNGTFMITVADNEPPVIPDGLNFTSPIMACGGSTNSNAFTFDWNDAGDNVGVWRYPVSITYPDGSDNSADYPLAGISLYTGLFDHGQGLYQFKVRAEDDANNLSGWSTLCGVTYDTVAPIVDYADPTPADGLQTSTNSQTLAATANSDATTCYIGQGEDSIISNASIQLSWYHSYPEDTSGTWTLTSPGGTVYYFPDRYANAGGGWNSLVSPVTYDLTSSFGGDDSAGTWLLTLTDQAGRDSGAITLISLNINGIDYPWSGSAGIWDYNTTVVPITVNTQPHIPMINDGNGTWSYTMIGMPEGQMLYRISCEDAAGNRSTTTDRTLTIDTVHPTAVVDYSTTIWTNQNVLATATADEPVTFTNVDGSIHSFSANGTFEFTFVDTVGNGGSATATVNNIDLVAPTTTADAGTYAFGDWTNNTNVAVTLTAVDDASGVSKIYWCYDDGLSACTPGVDGNGFGEYSAPLTFDAEGHWFLRFYSDDLAGNDESVQTVEIMIDKNITDPMTTEITEPQNGDTFGGIYTVTADAADGLSGIEKIEFYHQSVPTLIGTDSDPSDGFSIDWDTSLVVDGAHQLRVVAYDHAGNSSTDVIDITLDNTHPVIALLGGNFTLTVGQTFTDPGATTDDGSAIVKTGSVNTAVVGSYILRYNATDTAGNAAVEITRTVTVNPVPAVLGTTTTPHTHPAVTTTATDESGVATDGAVLAETTAAEDTITTLSETTATDETPADGGSGWLWYVLLGLLLSGGGYWWAIGRKRSQKTE